MSPEALAVRPGHGFPVIQARHVDPRPDHVLEPPAQRLHGAGDLVDDGVGLRGRVDAAQHAAAVGGGRPRDADARARGGPPGNSRRAAPTRVPLKHRRVPSAPRAHRVRRREGVEVVAQVARGGQERRHAVLVAAVAGNRRQRRDRRFELGRDRPRPSASPASRALSAMCDRSPSRAPTITAATPGCCITKRVATLAIDTPWRSATSRAAPQHPLQRRPAAGDADEAAVLHLRPGAVALPVGLGRAQPAIAEPAAAQRAVGQQRHVELLRTRRRARPRRADR